MSCCQRQVPGPETLNAGGGGRDHLPAGWPKGCDSIVPPEFQLAGLLSGIVISFRLLALTLT
jgi:hypothetical protein